eukprot:4607690-Lingulodinium_polyedra.AAC.1
MWRSRQDTWATRPAFSPAAAPPLDHYFAEHRVCVCGGEPTWGEMYGVVLGPGGSAAGTDGFPYE